MPIISIYFSLKYPLISSEYNVIQYILDYFSFFFPTICLSHILLIDLIHFYHLFHLLLSSRQQSLCKKYLQAILLLLREDQKLFYSPSMVQLSQIVFTSDSYLFLGTEQNYSANQKEIVHAGYHHSLANLSQLNQYKEENRKERRKVKVELEQKYFKNLLESVKTKIRRMIFIFNCLIHHIKSMHYQGQEVSLLFIASFSAGCILYICSVQNR